MTVNAMETEHDADVLVRLTKDLREAVKTMTPNEVRFLVDAYYQMQDNRIRSDGQIRSMSAEPHRVLDWLSNNSLTLEHQIKSALAAFADSQAMGQWAQRVKGIGPVLAAGLLAHIDLEPWVCAHAKERKIGCSPEEPCGPECKRIPTQTVGHLWAYGGLDPSKKWEKGCKRPWNASFKVLLWKCGESFVKVSGYEDDIYGHVYQERKQYEQQNNDAGKYAEQALARRESVAKNTDAWPWYAACYPAGTTQAVAKIDDIAKRAAYLKYARVAPGIGTPMLPPGHIQSRAKRYAVKLFLSHYFEQAYRLRWGKEPPLPYPIGVLGHAHKIAAPK